MNTVVTEPDDKANEEKRIRTALKNCGYPNWVMDKVKQNMEDKANNTDATKAESKKKKKTENKSKGMVVIPYVNGLTERLQRIFKKHQVNTAVKPHRTLRQILVHPKDKRESTKTGNCIYEIPCQNCDHSYIGETARLFEKRLGEHKAAVKKVEEKKFTRSERKASEAEQTKSAISDHVGRQNHEIDWDNHKILGREHNKKAREIREAMEIRKRKDKTLNREEGTYFLSHVYDPLLKSGNKSMQPWKPVSRESGSSDQI